MRIYNPLSSILTRPLRRPTAEPVEARPIPDTHTQHTDVNIEHPYDSTYDRLSRENLHILEHDPVRTHVEYALAEAVIVENTDSSPPRNSNNSQESTDAYSLPAATLVSSEGSPTTFENPPVENTEYTRWAETIDQLQPETILEWVDGETGNTLVHELGYIHIPNEDVQYGLKSLLRVLGQENFSTLVQKRNHAGEVGSSRLFREEIPNLNYGNTLHNREIKKILSRNAYNTFIASPEEIQSQRNQNLDQGIVHNSPRDTIISYRDPITDDNIVHILIKKTSHDDRLLEKFNELKEIIGEDGLRELAAEKNADNRLAKNTFIPQLDERTKRVVDEKEVPDPDYGNWLERYVIEYTYETELTHSSKAIRELFELPTDPVRTTS